MFPEDPYTKELMSSVLRLKRTGTEMEADDDRKQNILEVHNLKKQFTTGEKILHGCGRRKLFSESGEVLEL